MIEIKDLHRYEKDRWGIYGGLSGSKYGILIDGARWMVKFPENTKHFHGKDKPNHHIPAYTTSPISEYIGSKVYESLDIPVHETILGYRDGKIVVEENVGIYAMEQAAMSVRKMDGIVNIKTMDETAYGFMDSLGLIRLNSTMSLFRLSDTAVISDTE